MDAELSRVKKDLEKATRLLDATQDELSDLEVEMEELRVRYEALLEKLSEVGDGFDE